MSSDCSASSTALDRAKKSHSLNSRSLQPASQEPLSSQNISIASPVKNKVKIQKEIPAKSRTRTRPRPKEKVPEKVIDVKPKLNEESYIGNSNLDSSLGSIPPELENINGNYFHRNLGGIFLTHSSPI